MAATTMGMGVTKVGSRCPVCFGGMGHGQAIFTAECSHTFHLRCVPNQSICPVCAARWRDAPTSPEAPSAAIEPAMYGDDEPVEPLPPANAPLGGVGRGSAFGTGVLVLKTHCEYPAVAKAEARDGFGVVVHAKAPSVPPPELSESSAAASARAPLDLVTVLDVSSSMMGEKLELVKRAMGFLIDNLGSGDRLSVVAFASDARRVIRLTRMSEDGKAAAKRAVESLAASGCTNIRGGLDVAAMVLDGRRQKNAVASVILLSDGQDNQSMRHAGFDTYDRFNKTGGYNVLVPPSFRCSAAGSDRCVAPVHTFGFGTDHDAAAMHYVSEVTGGTFSFIENHAVIQDAFAQCIGGLLSVTVQKARISLECVHPGVRVRAVMSGCYESRIDAEGRAVTVDVGELYADEERRFLLFVDVPRAHSIDELATHLFKVRCTYLDTEMGLTVDVTGEDAVVLRPFEAAEVAPSMEVERERVRVEAAEDIALAREAAERGAYAVAVRILDARRLSLSRSAPALSGDPMCKALVAELYELSQRVSDEREYEGTGRASFLANMSSQAQQRVGYGGLCSAMFATPAMQKMENLSQMSREQQQQNKVKAPLPSTPPTTTTPQPENGSTAIPPRRWRLDARLAAAVPRLSMLRKYRRLLPLKR